MRQDANVEDRVGALLACYGTGQDGASPTEPQWRRIVERDPDRPISLVNLFKLREEARYEPGSGLSGTGQEAFDRYAAVSAPALARAGGAFLMVAPFEGMFAGPSEDWDLVVVGSYPGTSALLALFEDEAYQQAYFHRTAACEAQRVMIASG